MNARRVALLCADPAPAPDDDGVLVIDETGDRKWGTKTAHVGRPEMGRIGTVESGVVTVSSLWADARVYWPLAVAPFTPKLLFPAGKHDPAYRTKPQIARKLVRQAIRDGIPFRAVVADSFSGDNDPFRSGLHQLGVGSVLALKPSHAAPARGDCHHRFCWWAADRNPAGVAPSAPQHLPLRAPAAAAELAVRGNKLVRFPPNHETASKLWLPFVMSRPFGGITGTVVYPTSAAKIRFIPAGRCMLSPTSHL